MAKSSIPNRIRGDDMSRQQEIKTMDEYYAKYLPKYAKKYPITMRVSKEEADYLKWRRGEWQLNNKR